jgi:hypothetical protein
MATITKKAAKRISELLGDANLYKTLAKMSRKNNNGRGDYWRCQLNQGLAVRALFDEFGIEAPQFTWFTKDRIEDLKARVAELQAIRAA